MSFIDEILRTFDRNSPASRAAIDGFVAAFGFDPPDGYLEFMSHSNGGEGPVGGRYLMLWPIEELREHNEGYDVSKFAPGLMLFGSSGSGEAFAFDLRHAKPVIVAVPFVGMSLDEAYQRGSTFDEFLHALASP